MFNTMNVFLVEAIRFEILMFVGIDSFWVNVLWMAAASKMWWREPMLYGEDHHLNVPGFLNHLQ
jgi:hypothetical protein